MQQNLINFPSNRTAKMSVMKQVEKSKPNYKQIVFNILAALALILSAFTFLVVMNQLYNPTNLTPELAAQVVAEEEIPTPPTEHEMEIVKDFR